MTDVLVTGSTGLIGQRILQSQGPSPLHAPRLVPWIRALDGDVLCLSDVRTSLDRRRPAALLHTAWLRTGTKAYEFDPKNHVWAEGTYQLAAECCRRGIWFIGVGTGLEYAGSRTDAYTQSKIRLRESLERFGPSLDLTWLRVFWVLAPQAGRPRVLGQFLEAKQLGAEFRLREADRRLDFIHLDDVASAMQCVLRNQLKGDLDVGSGSLRSVQQLLHPGEKSRVARDTSLRRIAHDPESRAADISQLMARGWVPDRTADYFS